MPLDGPHSAIREECDIEVAVRADMLGDTLKLPGFLLSLRLLATMMSGVQIRSPSAGGTVKLAKHCQNSSPLERVQSITASHHKGQVRLGPRLLQEEFDERGRGTARGVGHLWEFLARWKNRRDGQTNEHVDRHVEDRLRVAKEQMIEDSKGVCF